MKWISRQTVFCAWLVAAGMAANGRAGEGTHPPCQILDSPLRPAYWAELSVTPDSTFDGFGETAYTEAVAGFLLGYYRLPRGELDAAFEMELITVLSSAGIGLPDVLGRAAIDVGWTVRDKSGTALQFRGAPGLYTDMASFGSKSWSMPMTIAFIRAFTPSLSGIAGVEMRPMFETPALPLVGLEWEVAPRLRVKAQLPESRVDWFFSDWWMTSLGCEWRARGFYMEEGAGTDRRHVEFDDLRACWKLAYQLSDDVAIGAQVGYVFDRSVQFRRPAPGVPARVDLEDNVFLGITVAGPF